MSAAFDLEAALASLGACPACGSAKFTRFCDTSFLGHDPRVLGECSGCGLSALLPMPSDAELGEYYSAVYFGWDQAKEDGKAWYFARNVLAKRPRGRFLDVGCAAGFFLDGVKRHSGWECLGQEYSPDAAAYARQRFGLEVRSGTLQQAAFEEACFDYIHCNNVMEHERDPLGLLIELRRILRPGGTLKVVVPNGRVDRQGYADYQRLKGGPGGSRDGHLFFFSPDSLLKLVQKAGLTLQRAQSAGMVRGMRALGILPRTPSWWRGYVPRGRRPVDREVQDGVSPGKAWPKAYFAFKHGREAWSRRDGFWKTAYDLHLECGRD